MRFLGPRLGLMLRAGAGGLLAVTLLLAFYLTAAHAVHARVHPDGDRADHVCVVTIFHAGGCEAVWCGSQAALRPLVATDSAIFPGETPAFILSNRTSILEHAPPARA